MFAMNKLGRFSARHAAARPASLGPYPEGRAFLHEIEGSWTRVEPRRQLALPPSVACAARTALLAWVAISLGAAIVHAHSGFGEFVAIETAEIAPGQAIPAELAVTAVALKPARIMKHPRLTVEEPVTLAALPALAVPSLAPAPTPGGEIPAAEAAPAEARLPKRRPEPPLVTAREHVVAASTKPLVKSRVAPRRTIRVRRPVYVRGYPVHRPRYYYGYRAF